MSLRFPLHAATLELSQARPEVFDPRETVAFLADRGFDTIVCFAVGYLHGEAYHRSAVAPARHGLGERDLFGEVVEACHARGLQVVGYLNSLFGGADAWEDHPDWTQRWADGRETTQGEAKAICPNSPYGRRIVAAAVEVAAGYAVDGIYLDEASLQSWCACGWCARRFREETGLELPVAVDFDDAVFGRWLEWRSEVVAGFIAEVGAAVRAARPGIAYIAQHAFPLSSTAQPHLRRLFWGQASGRMPPQFDGWYRPSFYGQDLPRVAPHLDLVSIEPWRRFSGQPSWWQGACVSYARAAGRGKQVLPLLEYAHFPWGLGRLSDSELAAGCADIRANGGDPWYPMYAPDAADRAGWDGLPAVFRAADRIRDPEDRQLASIGILMSRRTAERFGREAVDDRYLDGLIGAVGLVRELGLTYRVLSAEALDEAALDGLEVLVLPQAACLGEPEADRIRGFVEAGGGLVAIGWTATHDGAGRYRDGGLLADVLGVRLGPDTLDAGLGYLVRPDGGRDPDEPVRPVRDLLPAADPVGASVRFHVQPSWDLFEPPADGDTSPAVTLHQAGAGHVAWCGPDIGANRKAFEAWEARDLLRELISAVRPGPPAIEGVDLGLEVAVHAWEGIGGIRITLVNLTSIDVAGRSAPLADQAIRLAPHLAAPGARVVTVNGGQVTRHDTADGVILRLDVLREWETLIVATGP